MGKCHRNVNLEYLDTELVQQKKYGFWVLWGIFQEYIKQNIIMAVLRKESSHSVIICRLTKKLNVKEDPRWKTDAKLNFLQATKCLWGFNKKEY